MLLPVTDAVVQDHLLGKHVVGVYPLLPDETCWFLAADFDGPSWQDDIAAFRETCQRQGLPVAIERSRSGSGGHAWFFFEKAIPAIAARGFGSLLLTETQDRRPGISFTSYDRLFPNQDAMPKGGFGNLIALPLQQGGARPRLHLVPGRCDAPVGRPVGLPRIRAPRRFGHG